MTRPLLPPRGIFVGTELLFHPQITPAVRDTLLQLMALAWSSACHQTPPVTTAMLQDLTGKSERTLRAHLALLRSYPDVLRLHPAGKGRYYVTLAGWLFGKSSGGGKSTTPGGARARDARARDAGGGEDRAGRAGERSPSGKRSPESTRPRTANGRKRPLPGMKRPQRAWNVSRGGENWPEEFKEEEDSYPDLDSQLKPLLLPAKPARAKVSWPDALSSQPLPDGLAETLREAGVFPGLLQEVAGRAERDGYSESDLRALLAWCEEDEPNHPAALFIGRLRAGARAPADYRRPACPRCGQRTGHSQECPRRYAMDES